MSRPAALKPVDRMEMRLMREAGVPVRECAAYFGVSVATAMRILAELSRKLGPEKFKADTVKQRARRHLYTSQNDVNEPQT